MFRNTTCISYEHFSSYEIHVSLKFCTGISGLFLISILVWSSLMTAVLSKCSWSPRSKFTRLANFVGWDNFQLYCIFFVFILYIAKVLIHKNYMIIFSFKILYHCLSLFCFFLPDQKGLSSQILFGHFIRFLEVNWAEGFQYLFVIMIPEKIADLRAWHILEDDKTMLNGLKCNAKILSWLEKCFPITVVRSR